MADNVIKFPSLVTNTNIEPVVDNIADKVVEYKKKYSAEIGQILWDQVLGELVRAGVNLDNEEETYFPSMILLLEAIKSLHLETVGIFHPLQTLAHGFYGQSTIGEDEDGNIVIRIVQNVQDEDMIILDEEGQVDLTEFFDEDA